MLIHRKDGTVIASTEHNWDLSGQDVREADFRSILIEGGDFSDADLRAADFGGSELYGTFLYRANCAECSFRGALLRGVVLDEAILSDADFEGARLLRNNMGTPCSLVGADLRSAKLANSELTGCRYDATTIFPVGFDPSASDMIRLN